MALCSTKRWVSTAPYVRLTVTIDSETETTVTLAWTLQYIADYAAYTNAARNYVVKINGETVKDSNYDINGVTGTRNIASGTTDPISKATAKKHISFSVSFGFDLTWSGSYAGTLSASNSIEIPAKTSYTIKYDANGGSGAPASQTKWHGTTLTLSSVKPTRTGYTFKGWAKSSTGAVAFNAKDSYTANISITLYAVWTANTYTVRYNANGGSGAPGNQTKTHGKALTLSSTKPTRANYIFKGWATSATGSVAYAAGDTYTSNKAVTLYAVWQLSYVKPRVTNLTKARCDSSGNQSDAGTHAKITFDWACDLAVSSILIEWKENTEKTYANSMAVTASGTSGSVSAVIGNGAFDINSTYDIRIIVRDSGGYSAPVITLAGMAFILDFLAGGKGAAFGKPAEVENLLDIAWQTRLGGGIKLETLAGETDVNTLLTPNTYRLSSTRNYANVPVAGVGAILEIMGDGSIMQRWTEASKANPRVFVRFYYDGAWGAWNEFWNKTHFGKLLWGGGSDDEWSSGDITVPETDKYTLFLVYMSGQGTAIPVIKKSSYIRGVGGYVSKKTSGTTTERTDYTYHFAATFSGNTWTLVSCDYLYHGASGSHGARTLCDVVAIYGLV